MDSIAIINALYDTKCLKFGSYTLKSGVNAPYYMNLRRLPLYPNLMSSIEKLAVERFLKTTSTQQQQQHSRRQFDEGAELSASNKLENKFDDCRYATITTSSTASDGATDESDETREQSPPSSAKSSSPPTSSSASSASSDDDSLCWNIYLFRGLADDIDPIICGVPYGAIALAKGIADKAGLPLLFERKETKSYGDKQCLMDDFNQQTRSASHENQPTQTQDKSIKQRVILVEDVICSGESILDTVQSLARRNLQVEYVICIVNRQEGGIKLLLDKANIKVYPLFEMSDILTVLNDSGRLSDEQFVSINKWIWNNQFEAINGYPKDLTSEYLKSLVSSTNHPDDS